MSIGKHPTVLLRGLKAAFAALSLACGSCSDSTPSAPGPAPVVSVSVDPLSASMLAGTTQTLTATPKDAAGSLLTSRTVSWSSSDQSIATVSSGGLVTAVAAGSTTITATSEGKFGSAAITVSAPVATVSVMLSYNSVMAGQSLDLQVGARDAAGNSLPGRVVTLSSSDPTLAIVASNGFVSTLAPGTVSITATVREKPDRLRSSFSHRRPPTRTCMWSFHPSSIPRRAERD